MANKTLPNLTPITASLATLLAASNADGILGKVTLNAIKALISVTSSLTVSTAVPTTNPGTPVGGRMWVASTPGTYTNFAGIVIGAAEVAFLVDSGGTYVKVPIPIDLTGYVTAASIVDNLTSTSATVPLSANQGRILAGMGTVIGSASGKNLFNVAAALDGFYISYTNGLPAAQGTSQISDYIPVLPSTTYTISGRVTSAGSNGVAYYNSSKTLINTPTGATTWGDGALNGSYTTTAATAFMRITTKFTGVGVPSAIQVEKGSVATAYEAYFTVVQTLNTLGLAATVINDNVNNRATVATFTKDNIVGTTASKNKLDESAIVDGYVTGSGAIDTGAGSVSGWRRTGQVPLLSSTTYTFSAQSGWVAGSKNFCFYDASGVKVGSTLTATAVPYTFTTPAGMAYAIINLKQPADLVEPTQVMVELGSSATSYIAYSAAMLLSLYGYNVPKQSTSTVGVLPVVNKYPNVYSKLSGFLGKALYQTAGQDPIKIVMLGDSLFARATHTTVNGIDPSAMPPTFVTKNIGAYLWQDMKLAKPTYSRFDKAGRFTETGTWATATDLSNWDDAADIDTRTRRATTAGATLSFTSATSNTLFNLIDRTDDGGATIITIAVTAGNGVVQYHMEGSATWLEANGAVLSQRAATADNANGIGNTQYQRRIYFRKVSTGIGTAQTLTFTKDATTNAFMYWGLEEADGSKPYAQLIDVARGGHTIAMLKNYVISDVIQRKPNLVIFEVPLLNMIAADKTIDYNVNQVWDFVYGDRPGNTNALSLKAQSGGSWGNFQVLMVIPHYSFEQLNTDGSFITFTSGYTARDLYNAVKGLIISKGDLAYVDISSAMFAAIDVDPLFNGQYYTAYTQFGMSSTGYMNDGVHTNNKGTKVWATELDPIFMFNTF